MSPVQSSVRALLLVVIQLLMEGILWHLSKFERLYNKSSKEGYACMFARDHFYKLGWPVCGSWDTL